MGFRDGPLRRNRALEELLQITRTVIADGELSEEETRIVRRWVEENPDMLGVKVVDQLARTLRTIFADGRVDREEREELLNLLESAAGVGDRAPSEDFGKLPSVEKEEQGPSE